MQANLTNVSNKLIIKNNIIIIFFNKKNYLISVCMFDDVISVISADFNEIMIFY